MSVINKTICVCGAGTMGAGITLAAAQKGFSVKLYDQDPVRVKEAALQINNILQTLVKKEKISIRMADQITSQIQWLNRAEDCRADIIIEAIIEELPAKIELFRKLAAINGSEAVYASNTSSLSINAIAEAHPFPGRVAGLHFFNPATLMPLVEIISTRHSPPELIASLADLVKQMDKTPVICKDAPGFIVNRVARPFYIESLRLAEEGIPITVIDSLMTAAGFKMGPFKLMDLIGIDINYAVSGCIYEQLGSPPRLKPSPIQQQLISTGKLGRKTGAGFYTYSS